MHVLSFLLTLWKNTSQHIQQVLENEFGPVMGSVAGIFLEDNAACCVLRVHHSNAVRDARTRDALSNLIRDIMERRSLVRFDLERLMMGGHG